MTSKTKVICLGLGRTGTASMKEALEQLGFGPCYHMKVILLKGDPKDYEAWCSLGQDTLTLDGLRDFLKEYNSVTDYPAAIYYDKLYEAYPDAKFILTTRDPAKWEKSMRATILEGLKNLKEHAHISPLLSAFNKWVVLEMEGRYHENKLSTDPQGELLRHNQRVKDTIPAEKLLVYDVGQGWGPLVKFLGIEEPNFPFPHVNQADEYHEFVSTFVAKEMSES